MRCCCLLIICLWSLQVVAQDIRTSVDFSKYTQLHIQRVQRLGLELKKQYPNHFGDLDDKILQRFLNLHDQSKLKPEILKDLSQFYGRSMDSLTSTEKIHFTRLKDALNKQDFEIRLNFLKQNGLMGAEGKISIRGRKILYLEKVADLVDRGSSFGSPIEFGRPMNPASSYLKSPISKKMAQALESMYPKLTEGMKYKETFMQLGSKTLKVAGKAALTAGKILAAPLAIFGELADPSESIAADEEEFKIFYKKHPEFTPLESTTSKSTK